MRSRGRNDSPPPPEQRKGGTLWLFSLVYQSLPSTSSGRHRAREVALPNMCRGEKESWFPLVSAVATLLCCVGTRRGDEIHLSCHEMSTEVRHICTAIATIFVMPMMTMTTTGGGSGVIVTDRSQGLCCLWSRSLATLHRSQKATCSYAYTTQGCLCTAAGVCREHYQRTVRQCFPQPQPLLPSSCNHTNCCTWAAPEAWILTAIVLLASWSCNSI